METAAYAMRVLFERWQCQSSVSRTHGKSHGWQPSGPGAEKAETGGCPGLARGETSFADSTPAGL